MKEHQQQQRNHHQVAIALNNMGVSLLEKQAFAFAQETLRDAVRVLKNGCVDTEDVRGAQQAEEATSTPNHSTTTLAALQRANQRCCCATKASNNNGATVTMDNDKMALLPSRPGMTQKQDNNNKESNNLSLTETLAEGLHASSSYMSPVRIEPIEPYTTDDPCVRDFEIGVILYNLAISYRCLAETSPLSAFSATDGSKDKDVTPADACIELLLLTCGIMGSRISACKDSVLFLQMLPVAILVMSNMARVLNEVDNGQSNYGRVAVLSSELSRLTSTAREYAEHGFFGSTRAAAAA